MSTENTLNDLLQLDLPDLALPEEQNAGSRGDDPLDHLRVASPCTASWEEMTGDDLVRYCQHCRKNVYNISAMSRWDAAEFVKAAEGGLCVRFYRRRDGTLITGDCPVGWRAARRRAVRCLGKVAAGLLALLGVGVLERVTMMGAVARHPPAPPAPDPTVRVSRAATSQLPRKKRERSQAMGESETTIDDLVFVATISWSDGAPERVSEALEEAEIQALILGTTLAVGVRVRKEDHERAFSILEANSKKHHYWIHLHR